MPSLVFPILYNVEKIPNIFLILCHCISQIFIWLPSRSATAIVFFDFPLISEVCYARILSLEAKLLYANQQSANKVPGKTRSMA